MEQKLEKIKENYDKYFRLLRKFFPDDHDGIKMLEDELGERLILAPRDVKKDHGGVPGGLICFALEIAKYAKMFENVVNPQKLIKVMLIHELGKLGSLTDELLLPQTSQWHIENTGKTYMYGNPTKMSPAHRTLMFAARYCLSLDEDEWLAILTSSGFQLDENRFYANEIMPIAQALQAAKTFAQMSIKYEM